MRSVFHRFARLVRHRWAELQLPRALPAQTLQELEQLIVQSERSHTGQVRICVEAGLPLSYLWRDAPPRERALSQFAKLHVWDTEHNNGVLIYLLLADHAIEIVADRALARTMTADEWQTLISDMQSAFKAGHFRLGLIAALERVSQPLQTHFPRTQDPAGTTGSDDASSNLPDAPVVQRHLPAGRS